MSSLKVDTITDRGGTGTPYIKDAVLQVKQTAKTDVFTTADNTFVDVTGLTVDIAPKSASSKIMVEVHIGTHDSNSANAILYKLRRNSTDIGISTESTSNPCTFGATINADRGENMSMKFLDDPQTTSAITYGVQINGFGNSVDINKRASLYSTISTITVTEIGG